MEKTDQNHQKSGNSWKNIWEKLTLQLVIINLVMLLILIIRHFLSDLLIPASISTPTFDSELGVEVDTATVTVIPEVPEHSFYLMQWLRIDGNNQLIFFDRGANPHLVQGKMTVAAGFEITSSRPTSLTVVGGGNLKTEYGSY